MQFYDKKTLEQWHHLRRLLDMADLDVEVDLPKQPEVECPQCGKCVLEDELVEISAGWSGMEPLVMCPDCHDRDHYE